MPYNFDIKAAAPLPSGAIPTDEELDRLVARAHAMRSQSFARSFNRIFRRKTSR